MIISYKCVYCCHGFIPPSVWLYGNTWTNFLCVWKSNIDFNEIVYRFDKISTLINTGFNCMRFYNSLIDFSKFKQNYCLLDISFGRDSYTVKNYIFAQLVHFNYVIINNFYTSLALYLKSCITLFYTIISTSTKNIVRVTV